MWGWAALALAKPVQTEVEVVLATETQRRVLAPVMETSLGKQGAVLAGMTDLRGHCAWWTYERVQRQRVRTYRRRRRDRPGRPRVEREVLDAYRRIAGHREGPCEVARTDLVAVVSVCGRELRAPIDAGGVWEVVLPPCASAKVRVEGPGGAGWDLGDVPSHLLEQPRPELPEIPERVRRRLPADATPTACSTFDRGSTTYVYCEFQVPGGLIYEVEWSRGAGHTVSSGDRCSPCYPDTCLCPDCGDYDCAGGSGNGPNYVPGPVRVTGCDPFGLDRDRDGWGCE